MNPRLWLLFAGYGLLLASELLLALVLPYHSWWSHKIHDSSFVYPSLHQTTQLHHVNAADGWSARTSIKHWTLLVIIDQRLSQALGQQCSIVSPSLIINLWQLKDCPRAIPRAIPTFAFDHQLYSVSSRAAEVPSSDCVPSRFAGLWPVSPRCDTGGGNGGRCR